MSSPRLFLTDYASYNEGTQFEFGHWVDLDDFSDEVEFSDYITEHLAEADKKSPLGFGSIRGEPMFTDYEGFPKELYSESCSPSDLAYLFEYLALEDDKKLVVTALMDVWGYGIKEAIEASDDRYLTEFTDNAKYELFEMYYPEAEKQEQSNDYLTIDYDRFIDDCYTKVEIDGTTYLLEDR